jgi:hypothetical protein
MSNNRKVADVFKLGHVRPLAQKEGRQI